MSSEVRDRYSESSDDGHDLTSILQFLIRSGQVRVIRSDSNNSYDSDDECCPSNHTASMTRESLPDTTLIDKSDFKDNVLNACGEWDRSVKKNKVKIAYPNILYKRELGKATNGCFNSSEKCYISSNFIPNHRNRYLPYNHKIFCGVYSNDGNSFMTASQDANIRIYDTSDNKFNLVNTIAARDVGWSILDSVFSPDGHHFVYCSWSECLHICNVHGDNELHEPLPLSPFNRRFCVFSVAFSHDGKEIIGGACDENIYIYNLECKQRISRIHSHEDDVNAVTFADGASQILFSGGDDGLCKVWDRRTLNESLPKPVGILAGHLDGITYIDSKNDGRHLITNSKDQTIKLWDIRIFSSQEGQEATRQAVSRQSWDYRFQRVPKKLIGTKKKTSGDTSLMTYCGHTVLHTLIRCHFSPTFTTGQRYIYTGCASGRIVVYDSLSGQIESTISGQQSCVRDVSWHPYEVELVSTSWDGSIIQWTYSGLVSPWDSDCSDIDSSDSEEKRGSSSNLCGLRRSHRLAAKLVAGTARR